jgi:hypothetical protein
MGAPIRPGKCATWRGCGGDDPMTAVYILWLREVKRYLRSRPLIAGSLAQPLMYLLVLGTAIGSVLKDMLGFQFIELPGDADLLPLVLADSDLTARSQDLKSLKS